MPFCGTGRRGQLTLTYMQNINPNSLGQPPENLPVIVDTPVPMTAEVEGRPRHVRRGLSTPPELHEKVTSLIDELMGTFIRAMKRRGIRVADVHISWLPELDAEEAMRRVSQIARLRTAVEMKV